MKNTIHDAYVALLSGLTKYKSSTKEIIWEDRRDGSEITIEALDTEQELYAVRSYWRDGTLMFKRNYKDGQLHGKQLYYLPGKKLYCIDNYKNGVLVNEKHHT